MSLPPDEADDDLLQRAVEGSLDAATFAALDARLAREPALRARYREWNRLHHSLTEKFDTGGGAGAAPALPARRRTVPWRPIFLTAAAALAVSAGIFLTRPSGGPPAAVVIGPESRGHLSPQPSGRGEMPPGSRLELEHGSASLTFPGGVRIMLEGPGFLEYPERGEVRLGRGRAWLEVPAGAGDFVCRTDGLRLAAADAEFGVMAGQTERQEVHVLRGRLRLTPPDGDTRTLSGGESARWEGDHFAGAVAAVPFCSGFPSAVTTFVEEFSVPDGTPLEGKKPDQSPGAWQVRIGNPRVQSHRVDSGEDGRILAFAPLGGPPLDDLSHVLLVTLQTELPGGTRFQSDGWAGVSLYTGEQERIFVGDPNGPGTGWALHPVGWQAVTACPLLDGKDTVTLRYDYRSGLVELFEGATTTGPALASEWIEPGLSFDRIRIANGSQADAAVDAGMPAAAAGAEASASIRGRLIVRSIRVAVLSAEGSVRRAPGVR